MTSLYIAMIGTRGVPATFGGIEHHVEALGARLVERGHRVTVFAQEGYVGRDGPSTHRGIEVVPLPSVESKHLEAAVHAGRSTVQAMRRRVDVVHFHAVGPGWVSPLPRWGSTAAVVQTIHGLDAERKKWGRAARLVLRSGTWMAAHVPQTTITVSHALAQVFEERWGRTCVVIHNGVEPRVQREPSRIKEMYGLKGGDYALSLGRLVPEKQVDMLVRAFASVDTDMRLVVAGGSSYTDRFVSDLERLAGLDDRVVLPGYVHGEVLDELLSNAAVFCQPSALEGLPLTLLEAIEARTPVIASSIAPHREVLATALGHDPNSSSTAAVSADGVDGFVLHDPGDIEQLGASLARVLADLPVHRRAAETLAPSVVDAYDWDSATTQLEAVYTAAVAARRSARRSTLR